MFNFSTIILLKFSLIFLYLLKRNYLFPFPLLYHKSSTPEIFKVLLYFEFNLLNKQIILGVTEDCQIDRRSFFDFLENKAETRKVIEFYRVLLVWFLYMVWQHNQTIQPLYAICHSCVDFRFLSGKREIHTSEVVLNECWTVRILECWFDLDFASQYQD